MKQIYGLIVLMVFFSISCVPTFEDEGELADIPGILGVNAGNAGGNISATNVTDTEGFLLTVLVEDETVDFSNIYIRVSLEHGCIMEPLEGGPPCGTYGDFSTPRKYRVTAPSGNSADWTIVLDYE
jgi:hypothetical protein